MRSGPLTFVLGMLVGAFVGIPLFLTGAYLWQAGLDLRSPSSSREWVNFCARGREDIFCKAAAGVVAREVSGPFVLIYPGITGDRDLTAALTVWKGRYPTEQELNALVRANLFQGDDLETGQRRSLDGQVWRVTCAAQGRGSCRIGALNVVRHTRPGSKDDGAVYRPFGPLGRSPFLLPR
ncbi:hypothetical protein HLB42_20195 (plasmid) [Deinococcus sp. D7000]|nr:hypothetical protein HLB42_20195 [Deinococcus sp. D7000]